MEKNDFYELQDTINKEIEEKYKEIEEKYNQLDAIELLLATKKENEEKINPENYSRGSWITPNRSNVFTYFMSLIPANQRLHIKATGGHYNNDGSKINHNFDSYFFMTDNNTLLKVEFCATSKEGKNAPYQYQCSISTYKSSGNIIIKADPQSVYADSNIGIFDIGRKWDNENSLFGNNFSSDYAIFDNQNLNDVLGNVNLDAIIINIIEKYHLEEKVNQQTR